MTPQVDHAKKNEPCSEDFITHLWGFQGDRWEIVHCGANLGNVTNQINHLTKNKPCSEGFITHIYGVSKEIDGKIVHL